MRCPRRISTERPVPDPGAERAATAVIADGWDAVGVGTGDNCESVDAVRPAAPRAGRRLPLVWVGMAPFFAWALAFLLVPSGALLVGAFRTQDGEFTTEFIKDIFKGSSLGPTRRASRSA